MLFPVVVQAPAPDEARITVLLKGLDEKLKSMKSLTAELWFTGVYEPLASPFSVRGELAMEKPNRFKLVVKQGKIVMVSFVSDGKNLYTLLPPKTYTKEPAREKLSDYWDGLEKVEWMLPSSSSTPKRYLGMRTFGEETLEGIEIRRLKETTRVYFDKDGFPRRYIQTITRPNGTEVTSEIRLANVVLNPKIAPETFVFTPPKDAVERKSGDGVALAIPCGG